MEEYSKSLNVSQKAIIYTIICFGIYLFSKTYFSTIKSSLDSLTHNGLASYILTYAILGIPLYVGTLLINPKENILKNLGIYHNPIRPFLIALIFSLPMLLGGFIFFDFNTQISTQNLIAGSIIIGFVEELFFRGFLFGQLYKYTRLGFLSAIVIGALIFASGHLYQSERTMELIGIFSVTFMGAILFAWLYVEWEYNLWVPIFLHAFMNLAWGIFDMDSTALGGIMPNVLRGLTIAFAIVGTIFYKKKKKREMNITKNVLFVQPQKKRLL